MNAVGLLVRSTISVGSWAKTLAAYHSREVAAPPTTAEIYEANRRNRERCMMTLDLFKESK